MTDADGMDWPPIREIRISGKDSEIRLSAEEFIVEGTVTGRISSDEERNIMPDNRILAETYRRRAEELEAKAMVVESFGRNEQYPEGAVLFFQRNFGCKGGTTYSYAALKVGDYWFITGKSRHYTYSWEQLIKEHLAEAKEEGNEVWFATRWEQV